MLIPDIGEEIGVVDFGPLVDFWEAFNVVGGLVGGLQEFVIGLRGFVAGLGEHNEDEQVFYHY